MTVEDSTAYRKNSEVFCEDIHLEYSVFFEDNGRVAYAYLLKNREILSDVWLYNHEFPPPKPEWDSPEKLPFVNPINFALNQEFIPIQSTKQVSFRWRSTIDKEIISVEIYLRGTLYGILKPGFKPGFAKLAAKDGPLARVLYKSQMEVE